MRRISKAKKGKAAANGSKETVLEPTDAETQDNGNPVPSDEEENSGDRGGSIAKKNKRGKKNIAAPTGDSDSDTPISKAKKGKKGRKGDEDQDEDSENVKKEDVKEESANEDEGYEVEKVVDSRVQGGVKQFKIRWKGCDEEADTWESEADLNCSDLIKEYLAENPDAFNKNSKSGKSKEEKKRKKPADSPKPKEKKRRGVEPVSEDGESEEKVYEVEKVLEVHFKRNGEREFLIRWKGFGSDDDSWEPESNLNCTDLIKRFMEKVEKAKEVGVRELRTNPQTTNRFELQMHKKERRLSSRHTNKDRATYYDAE